MTIKADKAPTNGTGKSIKPAKKAVKSSGKIKEMTAREATLKAWQKTYENRQKRLA